MEHPILGRLRALLGRWDDHLNRRRWLLRAIAGLNVVLLVAGAAPFVLWRVLGPDRFDDLDLGSVPVAGASDAPPPVAAPDVPLDLAPTVQVTLLFSVGSRGMSVDETESLRVNGASLRGNDGLTDTIMLLVADTASKRAALLSIPRDLWMFDRGHRINATFNLEGAQAFVHDVSRVTGLPIHHVVQINFAAFAHLVDALGGVAVRVDRPLADLYSVMYVPEPGCWAMDGVDALGWARSRHTLTLSGGRWRPDPSASDIGRMARQRQLLGAAWEQVRGPRLLTRIPDLLQVARHGLVVDDGFGLQDVRDLAAAFVDVSAGRVESFRLPTHGRRIHGAAAQVLDDDAARPVLSRLRSWPPAGDTDAAALPLLAAGPDAMAAVTAASPTLDVDPECTMATARSLPDPRDPLSVIAAERGGAGTEDGGAASASPSPSPSPSPSASPSPTPSATPTDEPSPEPTDDPSTGPSGLPVPLPWDP